MIPNRRFLQAWVLWLLGVVGGTSALLALEEDSSDAGPFRVVRRDGSQEVGDLFFRWTDYAIESGDETGVGGGGGRGPSGRGPGGRGPGGGGQIGDLLRAVAGVSENGLFQLDRVEQGGTLLFQARGRKLDSPYLDQMRYAGEYGGLGFTLTTAQTGAWEFVEASGPGMLAVRRSDAGEIVARVRLYVHAEGDGVSRQELKESALAKERLFREIDRDRFVDAGVLSKEEYLLGESTMIQRAWLFGTEQVTALPLHLETNIPKGGPFLPAVEIMARGEKYLEYLTEARGMLNSWAFEKTSPVAPPDLPAEEQTEPDDSGDGGGRGGATGGRNGGGGGNPYQQLQALPSLDEDSSSYIRAGKYVNEEYGVTVRAGLPDGWIYTRADRDGFVLLKSPGGAPSLEVGGLSFAVMNGLFDGKAGGASDGPQWAIDRYHDSLVRVAPDGKYKPKRSSLGGAKGQLIQFQQETQRGKGPAHLLFVVVDGERSFVASAVAYGNGTRSKSVIEEAMKVLKSLRISK